MVPGESYEAYLLRVASDETAPTWKRLDALLDLELHLQNKLLPTLVDAERVAAERLRDRLCLLKTAPERVEG